MPFIQLSLVNMKHQGTKLIETERLILRQFKAEDNIYMFKNWANDDEVTKFLTWRAHKSVEDSTKVISSWVQSYKAPDFYNWAICLKETGEPIGNIAVVRYSKDLGVPYMGYCIGRAYWHKGITAEALKGVIDFLFNEVNVPSILAAHDVNNPHSGGVMQKAGLRYTKTIYAQTTNNQGVCDVKVYVLTQEEYKKAL